MRWRPRKAMGHGSAPKILIMVCCAGLLAGCARGSDPDESGTDASSSSPGVDLSRILLEPVGVPGDRLPDSLSTGAALAARFCSSCHSVPAPSSHSAADWSPILRNMFLRMERISRTGMGGGMMGGMMGGGRGGGANVPLPTSGQKDSLLAYYQAHALHAISGGAQPPTGPGQELFKEKCGLCHALPDPASYPAARWPAIVATMRQYMDQRSVGGITEEQAGEIVSYLERSSGG